MNALERITGQATSTADSGKKAKNVSFGVHDFARFLSNTFLTRPVETAITGKGDYVMSVRLKFLSGNSEIFTMTTNVMESPLDKQWLDFYALLEVPVDADEATLRRRIGRVYSDASANAEHRDLQKRMWYQSLIEHVLPQARRVLLDAAWRAKYDRQHILHSIGDPSAQPYVAFIASMRGGEISNAPGSDLTQLPAKMQDEILAAREVVECARAGLQLELLPSQAVRTNPNASPVAPLPSRPLSVEVQPSGSDASGPAIPTKRKSDGEEHTPASAKESVNREATSAARPRTRESYEVSGQTELTAPAPRLLPRVPAPLEKQAGEPARAKVMTAQEANARRRRARANTPAAEPFVSVDTLHDKLNGDVVVPARANRKKAGQGRSRVVVGDDLVAGRTLSPTSLHLLVAITGVLLTISIQRFAATPAVATGAGRLPVLVAASPEMASALGRLQSGWNKTPEGQNFDIVVQTVEGEAGVRRVLGHGGMAPDAWMPSSNAWLDRYNSLAPRAGREPLSAGDSVAGTPVVLLVRAEHAGELTRRFPDHRVPSWSALRAAVGVGAPGRFGLSDPQQTAVGALSRFSMAREWGESHAQAPAGAVKSGAFWEWMKGFESNTPSAYGTTGDLVNDLSNGSASRLWWGLAYESDAITAMNAGKNVEVWYLPRTILADHPFYGVERVGAPVEVSAGRATFERFLRSDEGQKNLLLAGMRPTRFSLGARIKGNPFGNTLFQERGLRATLPRDERSGTGLVSVLGAQWAKRFK